MSSSNDMSSSNYMLSSNYNMSSSNYINDSCDFEFIISDSDSECDFDIDEPNDDDGISDIINRLNALSLEP